MTVIDLFAGGAGGWDLAARQLGLDPLGIEFDEDSCATREAAGLRTLRGDVAALDPIPCHGLIASPPCQAWSRAGKRLGILDQPLVFECLERLAAGEDARAELGARCKDDRSLLVVEPLRWALAVEPGWVALEQVEDVLPCWERIADVIRGRGYHAWTGVLNAADYGVPQTRKRAILMASRARRVGPPPPTHSDQRRGGCLLGLAPWVSMADALGWDGILRSGQSIAGVGRAERATDEPSLSVIGRFDLCRLISRRDSPAWVEEHGPRENRDAGEPAPTFTAEAHRWTWERPATAVCGDPRISPPGYRGRPDDYESDGTLADGKRRGDNAVRVTVAEAATLQDLPADHPWQGNKTSVFRQIGNAITVGLARAALQVAAGGRARQAA